MKRGIYFLIFIVLLLPFITFNKTYASEIKLYGSEPVGQYKFVKVYKGVPYYSDIDSHYFYSDEYYEGYIPLVRKDLVDSDGRKLWLLFYEGQVRFKK